MEKSRHALYLSSLLSESPSVRDSHSRHANRFTNSFEQSSMHLLSASFQLNQSLFLDPNDDQSEPEEEPALTLAQQFFDVCLKLGANHDNVFDMLTEFELLCCDHLSVTKDLLAQRVRPSDQSLAMTQLEHVLRLERNSWRLVHALLEDRVRMAVEASEEMIVDNMISKMSDKELIATTLAVDARMRRMQIVVDWLERNHVDDSEETARDNIQFYSEGPFAWENTLHALKTKAGDNYAKERALCDRMDPDGPIRTKRPLHDLDVEDENRLYRCLFQSLRAGQLEDGKDVAQRLGFFWLAAALDGWLLHHDPNFAEDQTSTHKVLEPVEGNPNRDLWKHVCWRASRVEGTNIHERAVFGALSGNVAAVLPLCSRWSDKLWAYFRCSLDVHVEHELRQTLVVKPEAKPRFRVDLPDAYWDNKLSAEEIFREIESRASGHAMPEERCHQSVQKLVVLQDIEALIDLVYECAKAIADSRLTKRETKAENQVVEPQLLRFFAHLVLALRHLNLSTSRESLCDAILESYISYLIDRRQPELVAFYTAKLPAAKQVPTFARLLEGIEDENDRKMCIVLAKSANLDISAIAATVVDNMRSRSEDARVEVCSDLNSSTTSEDLRKINSLDWLLFSEVEQWSEALRQANALMRAFLLLRKVEAMKATFAKLPPSIIDSLFKQSRRQTGRSELSAADDNAVREFLCHKAYIEANDAFTDWLFCLHNSKPKEPPKPTSSRFMDTVAHEHALKQFELETHHWREMLKKQGRSAANKIESVLLFPDGGWMADQRDDAPPDELRTHQMEQLRREYIPQLVFIAHSVHKSSGNLVECLRVADIVADEDKAIYKTFSRELVRDLLKKLRETAIEVLSVTSDPLCYPSL